MSHGQGKIRPKQAAREHRHDRSRRPRQDDADGGDHEGAGEEGQGAVHGVRPDRQGARRARARHHDRDGARRVRVGQAPLRARRLPGPRRLHQEHDHGRGADGRRDPGGVGARRPDAADARAHPARPPGRRAGDRRVPEQGGHDREPTQELLDLVEMEVRELLSKYKFPGDDTPIIRGSALKALEGDAGELGEPSIRSCSTRATRSSRSRCARSTSRS